jgi:alpha-ketoglutarate-dependent taurine dioxygenase
LLHELKEKGYVSISSVTTASTLDVVQAIGHAFKVPTMPLVQTLTPRLKENEQENTYSGNFGVDEFPFHTDLAHWYIPPRYFFLRCIVPAPGVDTKLIDSKNVCDGLESVVLSRAHFKPRKRLDRTANILKVKDGEIFRWDSIFIEPSNHNAEKLSVLIEDGIRSAKCIKLSLDKKGECLLIDNWRMLHARGAIGGDSMDRKIERVYFSEVIF